MIFCKQHFREATVTVLAVLLCITVNMAVMADDIQPTSTVKQPENGQTQKKSVNSTNSEQVQNTSTSVNNSEQVNNLSVNTPIEQGTIQTTGEIVPQQNTQGFNADESQLQVIPDEEIASLGGLIEPRDFEGLTTEQLITTDIDGSAKNNTVITTRIELDIPVPDNELVDKHRNTILSNYGREWLYKIMSQASLYYDYIIEEMHDNDMPECIACLPVIESSYVRTAVSKSGAVGLWQFMENSIEPFLIKNHWVDERLDPWLSTEAAIKKLKDNYNVLGDWYLALAAYNCGLGATKRALAKSKVKDFWYMAENNLLPAQTIQYVPRFLAVADIIKNADYYGIELPESNAQNHPAFVKLTINKAIDIPLLSDMTGIKTEVFDFLNPALKYNMTPPLDEYFIRVPADSSEKIAVAIENLDESMYSGQYTVRQGDTLWGISRKYEISVADLCTINKLKEKAILRIGTVLNVPILK